DMLKGQRVVYNKYYVDELYDAVIRKPLDVLSDLGYRFFELRGVDAIVNGFGTGVKWMGNGLRLLQTGNVGFYIFAMVISIILILVVNFI
ncbi:MAG: NADH-quinone oxidoreductase subunit L, partial [Bacteroidia bacterium]